MIDEKTQKILIDFNESKAMYSIEQAAAFYKTNSGRLRQCIHRNRDTFNEEIEVFHGETLKKTKKVLRSHYFKISSLTIIKPRGLIRLGLLIKNNEVAEKIKKAVLSEPVLVDYYKDILLTRNQALKKQFEIKSILSQTFSGLFEIKEEQYIGKYRVDFILNNNVIVECDEFGHRAYDQRKELERENFLKSQGYQIVRYNPDDCNTSVFEIINKILIMINKHNAA